MKKVVFFAIIILLHVNSFAQCTTVFAKIAKYEEGFAKDKYGNVTNKRVLKCTFTDGTSKSVAGWDVEFSDYYQESNGRTKQLFVGTNASKTVFLRVIQNGSVIRVNAYQFKKYGKQFTDIVVEWDPSLNDRLGTRPYWDGFNAAEGWAFSKFSGDVLVMTKNGVEYKFTTVKTEEKLCSLCFKML